MVLSDGICPGCGRSAPICEYLESIRRFGGLLILDDTQALGILGKQPSPAVPYGLGGGGSLQYSDVTGSDIVVVNSLAKAFGAPVAVLVGGSDLVKRFESESDTRLHCSPPSTVAINAAHHALKMNENKGDALRQKLVRLVSRFRTHLDKEGLVVAGTLFPVQGVAPVPGLDVIEVYEQLLAAKVRTVLKRSHLGTTPQLALLITVDLTPSQIDEAAAALLSTIHNLLRR